MQRIGRVVKAEKHGVMVIFERISACRGCGACGRDIKSETIYALGEAKINDVVRVETRDSRPTRSSVLTYPLYALGFLAGLIISNFLTKGNEAVMVLGGAAGLALSGLLLKLPVSRPAAATANQSRVISVNDPEDIREINEEGICPKTAAWSSSKQDE